MIGNVVCLLIVRNNKTKLKKKRNESTVVFGALLIKIISNLIIGRGIFKIDKMNGMFGFVVENIGEEQVVVTKNQPTA